MDLELWSLSEPTEPRGLEESSALRKPSTHTGYGHCQGLVEEAEGAKEDWLESQESRETPEKKAVSYREQDTRWPNSKGKCPEVTKARLVSEKAKRPCQPEPSGADCTLGLWEPWVSHMWAGFQEDLCLQVGDAMERR